MHAQGCAKVNRSHERHSFFLKLILGVNWIPASISLVSAVAQVRRMVLSAVGAGTGGRYESRTSIGDKNEKITRE